MDEELLDEIMIPSLGEAGVDPARDPSVSFPGAMGCISTEICRELRRESRFDLLTLLRDPMLVTRRDFTGGVYRSAGGGAAGPEE